MLGKQLLPEMLHELSHGVLHVSHNGILQWLAHTSNYMTKHAELAAGIKISILYNERGSLVFLLGSTQSGRSAAW